jgi:hypothetical protein
MSDTEHIDQNDDTERDGASSAHGEDCQPGWFWRTDEGRALIARLEYECVLIPDDEKWADNGEAD